jgi:hypothetical protein
LTYRADSFADFVNGIVHGRTGALGGAAGAGASKNKKGGDKDKKSEWFHKTLLKHAPSGWFKP